MPGPTLEHRYYKRTGICFAFVGGMMALILLKGLSMGTRFSGILLPMLLTVPLFLFLLWQAFSRCLQAFLELPSAPAGYKRNLPEALWLLAFVGAVSMLVALSAGFVLGKAAAH